MNNEPTVDLERGYRIGATRPYLIELQTSSGPRAYVVAQAGTVDDARALVDAQLGRDDDSDDIVILAVHPIH